MFAVLPDCESEEFSHSSVLLIVNCTSESVSRILSSNKDSHCRPHVYQPHPSSLLLENYSTYPVEREYKHSSNNNMIEDMG